MTDPQLTNLSLRVEAAEAGSRTHADEIEDAIYGLAIDPALLVVLLALNNELRGLRALQDGAESHDR